MKTMCRIFLVLLITIAVSYELSAQNYFFAEARENEISATAAGKRVIIPEKYKSRVLDIHGMQAFLENTDSETRLAGESQGSGH